MAHITAVESMASQLQDLEAPVPEEAVMMKIITTLPDDYRFLETAWDSTPDENKNLENLRARLVQEEKKITKFVNWSCFDTFLWRAAQNFILLFCISH